MISILDINNQPITINSIISYAVSGKIKTGRVSKLLLAADDTGTFLTRAQIVSPTGRRSTIKSVETRCVLSPQ
jgi:hypothetical protein